MKKLFISFILALAIMTPYLESAHAIPASAGGRRWVMGTDGTVGTTNWAPLLPTSSKAIKGISVVNNTASVMELGINTSGAASTDDVRQLVIPSRFATSGAQTADAVFLPLSVSQGYRISIRALGSSATVGEFQLNYFYY